MYKVEINPEKNIKKKLIFDQRYSGEIKITKNVRLNQKKREK